jgi:acrylyl-CoA reductase (NADPH)
VPARRPAEAWARLARDLDVSKLDLIAHGIALSDAISAASELLAVHIRGRIVVDVNR